MSLECDKKLFVPLEQKKKKLGLVDNSLTLRYFLYGLPIAVTHELQNFEHKGIPGIFPPWNKNDHPLDICEK